MIQSTLKNTTKFDIFLGPHYKLIFVIYSSLNYGREAVLSKIGL